MGEIQLNTLKFYGNKVVNDPAMAPKTLKDASGATILRIETYCNIAFARIAHGCLGMESFFDIQANDIYDYLYRLWDAVLPAEAHKLALEGKFVGVARKGKPHGHVAVVAPEPMVFSGKWNIYVPMVYNVGGLDSKGESMNGILGVNYCFKDPPDFFRKPKYD